MLHQSLRMMFLMFLNQVITFKLFFHWFTFVLLKSDLLILCKMCWLILAIFDFDGFICLNDGEFEKLSWWSFTKIKASVSGNGFNNHFICFIFYLIIFASEVKKVWNSEVQKNKVNKIDSEAKKITKKLKQVYRIQQLQEAEIFLSKIS